jgi:hypothetical protein
MLTCPHEECYQGESHAALELWSSYYFYPCVYDGLLIVPKGAGRIRVPEPQFLEIVERTLGWTYPLTAHSEARHVDGAVYPVIDPLHNHGPHLDEIIVKHGDFTLSFVSAYRRWAVRIPITEWRIL